MRTLTRSESRLLAGFVAAIVLAGSLLLASLARRLHAGMDSERAKLRQQQFEAEIWRQERSLWEERAAWLDSTQPRYPVDGNPSSALLQKVQESAANHGLTILEQSLTEPVSAPAYREVAVRVKVSATLEQLTRWVVELQQPALFQAVTSFSIRSDKEPPKILCDLQIARWYAP